MLLTHVILLRLLLFSVSSTQAAPFIPPPPHTVHNFSHIIHAHIKQPVSRVINGQPVTDKTQFPFVVDLSFHPLAISSSRFCTATLITPDIVLTAAHCVLNDGYKSSVYATVGRIQLQDNHPHNHHAQTFRAVASLVHPHYRGLASPNDVALILLNASSAAQTVHLAPRSPTVDDVAWVVGYGIQMLGTIEQAARPIEVFSKTLQKTALKIMNPYFCSVPELRLETAPGMLCTAGVNKYSSACRGDSGGGLFLPTDQSLSSPNNASNVLQVGIVSYGDAQCSSKEAGVFTDVASVKEWILSSTERLHNAFNSTPTEFLNSTTREITSSRSPNQNSSSSTRHRDHIIWY